MLPSQPLSLTLFHFVPFLFFFHRLFVPKSCARCTQEILMTELVMRAQNLIYHVDCFSCHICDTKLTTGQHFGTHKALVYCRENYEGVVADQGFAEQEGEALSGRGLNRRRGEEKGGFGGGAGTKQGRPRKKRATAAQREIFVQNICT